MVAMVRRSAPPCQRLVLETAPGTQTRIGHRRHGCACHAFPCSFLMVEAYLCPGAAQHCKAAAGSCLWLHFMSGNPSKSLPAYTCADMH